MTSSVILNEFFSSHSQLISYISIGIIVFVLLVILIAIVHWRIRK
jgi:hypothetical protein